METRTVRITYVKSAIGYDRRQKDTIKALGLHRLGDSVEHVATEPILGMVASVRHLVKVEEVAS
ncbi:MAG: 50S ribosomal protein L30 [Anaerolineae bacterium]|jgi:large subunit ribosomal protein L30|nr:50S ribosomal protein L30 [Chloroflexota bacterium]